MRRHRINVTESFVPSIELYNSYVSRAFASRWLTNRGELTLLLEQRLKDYLGLKNVLLTSNGTIPMQIALKLLAKGSEVITTPFSYIATTSCILWENCDPVFVDIDPEYWTINEQNIESAITDKTKAILATHVFGNPCEVERLEEISNRHNLALIYDAAHCFGVRYKGKSVFDFGDLSSCSFHATKLFHTGEGGMVTTKDDALFQKVYHCHNFGHKGQLDFHRLGINGKLSELQSAMGLCVLDNIESILFKRAEAVKAYYAYLENCNLRFLKIREGCEWNYSYMPVLLKSETQVLKVEKALNIENIFPRRYFYPALNTVGYVDGPEMPVAEEVASSILCLPLSHAITIEEIDLITTTIKRVI